MPPSCGKRDDSSVTTSPCGTKKNTAASTQSDRALGPDLAAVASHRSPTTATRLKRTRSRRPSARLSVEAESCASPRAAVSVIRSGLGTEDVAGLHEQRVVGAAVAAEAEARREVERFRSGPVVG